jgi:hypothetical protein
MILEIYRLFDPEGPETLEPRVNLESVQGHGDGINRCFAPLLRLALKGEITALRPLIFGIV